MSNSCTLAAKLLHAYESRLPLDMKATSAERLDAMRQAIEQLGLVETVGVKFSTADGRVIAGGGKSGAYPEGGGGGNFGLYRGWPGNAAALGSD